jgi:hypothetical protein
MFDDYESWGQFQHPTDCTLLEAYSGVSAVSWYGSIERQLVGMEQTYKSARNEPYAVKIHTFLQTWRDNQITGSINRETIEVLEAATEQLAVDPWRLANYFSNLRDQLRKLIASMEEMPLGDMVQAQPRNRRSAGPNSFGPRKAPKPGQGAPGEEGGQEGAPGAPPADGEQPPAPNAGPA